MVLSISGGTGFLPSTVWQCLKTRDPSKWTVVSVLYFVDLSSHHIFEEASKYICESYICTWNMYRLYSGCFSEEQDERHFGLWAKSHLLMSMDHTANEEASTSNDPMNIGRGMERWRRLVSIPSMIFFLPQCGKTPERTPGRQLRCESSSIQREGGFHKVFTREGDLLPRFPVSETPDVQTKAGQLAVTQWKEAVFFWWCVWGGDRYILRT